MSCMSAQLYCHSEPKMKEWGWHYLNSVGISFMIAKPSSLHSNSSLQIANKAQFSHWIRLHAILYRLSFFWAGVLHHQLYLTWKCSQDERVKNMSFVWAQLKIQLSRKDLCPFFRFGSGSALFIALHFNVCKSCLLAHFDIFWSSSDDWEEKLKDRFMINFAFHRFLSDIKLTERYFFQQPLFFAIPPTFWRINCTQSFPQTFPSKIFLPRVWKTVIR